MCIRLSVLAELEKTPELSFSEQSKMPWTYIGGQAIQKSEELVGKAGDVTGRTEVGLLGVGNALGLDWRDGYMAPCLIIIHYTDMCFKKKKKA